MHTVRRCHIAVLLLSLLPAGPAAAQQIFYRADSAKIDSAAAAGVALVHWVQSTYAADEQSIYVRNISHTPIRITSFEIYDCLNLGGHACGVHSPGPLVAPGKTARLIVIERAFDGSATGFKYRIYAMAAPDSGATPAGH